MPTSFLLSPANFTMERLIFLSAPVIFAFWAAALSIKVLTAVFSASMRFVLSLLLMEFFILPEASSTMTISRACVLVVVVDA